MGDTNCDLSSENIFFFFLFRVSSIATIVIVIRHYSCFFSFFLLYFLLLALDFTLYMFVVKWRAPCKAAMAEWVTLLKYF